MVRLSGMEEKQEYGILRETAASYAAKELAPLAEEADLEPGSPRVREAFLRAGDLGLFAALLPEDAGGGGLDEYAFCVALEEIAVESAGLAAALLAHNAALYPTVLGELQGLITGIGGASFPACLAFPGEVSRAGDRVNGSVPFALNAAAEGAVVVLVQGEDHDAALALGREAEGLQVTPEAYPLGLRPARPGALRLEGVSPANAVTGAGMVEAGERLLYVGLASIGVGIARKALGKAHAYACERYQAGKTIIQHQGIRLLLAGMVAVVEEGRTMVRRACESREMIPAMTAWLRATQGAFQAATDGVQVHGGYGYMRDYGMERLMRDAKYCQVYPHTPQEVLLRMLALSEG